MDESTLKEMWGALAIRGMALIAFGIAAVFWPGITLVTIVYLFGAYVLVSGIVSLVMGLVNIGDKSDTIWSRVLVILVALVELGIGVYLLRHPTVTFATLILLIALALIIRGLFDIFSGIFGEGGASYRTLSVIAGLVAGIVGIIMLLQPAASGVAFVWVLGVYALITGPLMLALAHDGKKALTAKK